MYLILKYTQINKRNIGKLHKIPKYIGIIQNAKI